MFPRPIFGPGRAHAHRTVRDAIADLDIPAHLKNLRHLKEGDRRHPNFGAGARRLRADAPFPTVKASDTNAARMIHPWFDRYLTMPELLRAQSFPDDFICPRRTPAIGNAVPPVLAWHLAGALSKSLSARTHTIGASPNAFRNSSIHYKK
ncbi:MAG: DNA cytosine methyltransferase [Deltaproteobacteria bacterium]|nr:DNA cytosine methyltransferase [Deltaproteobacteria bacterium]